ncbi:hypothetical protein N4G66_07500 [Streptomyces rhizosphaerihabitans]|nr:hypothetical protein [Streptomyces rhizosphaerihabitans]MCT9004755.1 hypothetical protein [Streptomyces rhizosphaerihabitans]
MRASFRADAVSFNVCRKVRCGEDNRWIWSAIATFKTPRTHSTSLRRPSDDPASSALRSPGISRGTGFWGPPFRVFAPSQITLLVPRSPHLSTSP